LSPLVAVSAAYSVNILYVKYDDCSVYVKYYDCSKIKYLPPVAALKAVQVSVNNVARSITGVKRSDRVRVAELNAMANLPTINELRWLWTVDGRTEDGGYGSMGGIQQM
jgi:hypothetical protein